MNPTQIKCFLSVASHLSFTKAAESLFMSQPVVSRTIASFEQEIGISLFERSRNTVSLTPTGEYLYSTLSKVIDDYDKAISTAIKMAQGFNGNISIGVSEGQLLASYFDNIFSYFWKERKNTKISITYYPHSILREMLETGEIDFALTALVEAQNAYTNVNYIETRSAPSALIVPASHPNADKAHPNLKDFNDLPFLLLDPEESETISRFQQLSCKKGGYKPFEAYAPNVSTLAMWLESGLGVSTFNIWHSVTTSEKVKKVSAAGLSEISEAIVWRKDSKNPNIPLFIEQIKSWKTKQ